MILFWSIHWHNIIINSVSLTWLCGQKVCEPLPPTIYHRGTNTPDTENESDKKEKFLQIKLPCICNINYHISFIKIPTYYVKMRISKSIHKKLKIWMSYSLEVLGLKHWPLILRVNLNVHMTKCPFFFYFSVKLKYISFQYQTYHKHKGTHYRFLGVSIKLFFWFCCTMCFFSLPLSFLLSFFCFVVLFFFSWRCLCFLHLWWWVLSLVVLLRLGVTFFMLLELTFSFLLSIILTSVPLFLFSMSPSVCLFLSLFLLWITDHSYYIFFFLDRFPWLSRGI